MSRGRLNTWSYVQEGWTSDPTVQATVRRDNLRSWSSGPAATTHTIPLPGGPLGESFCLPEAPRVRTRGCHDSAKAKSGCLLAFTALQAAYLQQLEVKSIRFEEISPAGQLCEFIRIAPQGLAPNVILLENCDSELPHL